MKSRKLIIRLAVLAACVAVAAVMMIIGRGHTIYLDNKTLEDYNGQTYSALHKIVVYVDGEEVTKLAKRDRGMALCIGQTFRMTLEITPEKGDEPTIREIEMKLPYSIDGIIVNLPALLADLPEEAWMSEFVPTPTQESEEPLDSDDLGLGDDMGLGGEF